MGCRDNSRIHEEYTWVAMQKSHTFKAYMTIIYRNSRMYVGFLKGKSHTHQKLIFMVFLGIFGLWCLLKSFS